MKKIVKESASNLWIYHHLTDIYNSAFFIVVFTEKPDLEMRELSNENLNETKNYCILYFIE